MVAYIERRGRPQTQRMGTLDGNCQALIDVDAAIRLLIHALPLIRQTNTYLDTGEK